MNSAYKKFIPGPTSVSYPPTPRDIEGPFYKAGAPIIDGGVIAQPVHFGDPALRVMGVVMDTNGMALPGAVLDIWQANPAGEYDNVGFQYRGKVRADIAGEYRFETVVPGDYDISEPTDSQPHDFRCSHIHVRVTAPGHQTLTTQLYFPDDKYNATDHWFDARRVIDRVNAQFNFILEAI